MIGRWFQRLKAAERSWRYGLGKDISTPEARRQARRHFLYIDHGILRIWWKNFHEIAPGVYRANQPSPERLAEFRDMGIRTILNLRGDSDASPYLFEVEACAELGLTLIDHRLYAAALASRDELLELIAIFRRIEKPFVMHCKSGSDRTGFAAILFLHIIAGQPLERAMRQLHWTHLHFRKSKNGILDLFFEAYLEASKDGVPSLEDWIATQYDPAILEDRFATERGRG